MTHPKLTVLMTVYNGGRYLSMSLKSVLGQTYRDFEFLIVNDCSTDNTLETIASFHDERIKIHHNATNLGQTKSLNVGLKLASGEYIARIDADDIALPQWLATQVDSIVRHPQCSVLSCYVLAVDEHNKIRKLYKPPVDRADIVLRLLAASPINHVGSVLRKRDIVEIGGYDEQYKTAADYDLWGRLIRKGRAITTTPKVLMAIREHAHSLSRIGQGKREFEELKRIISINIKESSVASFSEAEMELFSRVNYDGGNMTDEEFNGAVEVTKRVYLNLIPALGIGSQRSSWWARSRCRTIYLKKIFMAIQQKKYGSVRKLSGRAMKEFGLFNIFMLFWALSLLSGMILNFIPVIYDQTRRGKACLQSSFRHKISVSN